MRWPAGSVAIFFTASLLLVLGGPQGELISPAHADVDHTDLKSDLELEIEGYNGQRKKKKRPENVPEDDDPLSSTPSRKEQVSKPVSREKLSEIDAKIEQAQRLYDVKKYKEATEILKPYIDQLPRAGLLLLARCYAALEDIQNEIRILELCINKNPKDYVVKTVYGQALVRVKRTEDGILAFHEARQLNPRYKPAYDALIKELEAKGERYEARNVVSDMIKVFGNQGPFLTTLCRLYALDSYHEKTVEICEDATIQDSSVPENHMYLGLALKERENLERASRVLSRSIKRFPKSEPVHFAMGDLHMAKKDYVKAYRFFKTATAADPKSVRAWIGFANAAFKIQKNEEALKAFVTACKLDRVQTKDFRLALGEIRVLKDLDWQSRFESGINKCQE